MGEIIPLISSDLEEVFSANIAEYGYQRKKDNSKLDNNDEETYRTELRRQRDKILYTGGFRRLQDKTQVISATVLGDHRTRLTHTLEVEQIAISIANALQLNVDLVSAIALGHDVGHTPFGHAAERKLNKLLKDNGQFHHPIQSVRYLWEKYGSKIEQEIYEGILLHDSDMFEIEKSEVKAQFRYLKNVKGETIEFENWVKINEWINSFPSTLEAQVVIWADKIAYITHDLEDFLRCSAFTNLKNNDATIEKKLCCILNKLIVNKSIRRLKNYESRDLIRNIISNLINSSAENINLIDDLTQDGVKKETEKRYKSRGSNDKTKDNKKYLDGLLINFSDAYRAYYYELRKFLDKSYILSPEVQKSDAKAEVIIDWLFNKLSSNYKLLPLKLREEVDNTIDEVYNNQAYVLSFKEKIEIYIEYIDVKRSNPLSKKIIEDIIKNKIREKVISRKVACYIATMSDTYAENMYRDLLGSRGDFIL
ncbi:deoxyguanosinetriphosphate triphosphohydrolase family protein [Veillonella denticariosi]|uniref:deoxyguanosinetriphosphate triphosphohydrolase family protein n=1 Tax=Veillonella denticariosi TaxID=419208 RepID=UPI0024910405|nr:dNTP triphosphohydrolase [Veillonella denticariosi]